MENTISVIIIVALEVGGNYNQKEIGLIDEIVSFSF